MKGLLIKDWKLAFQTRKLYLVLFLLVVICLNSGKESNITFSAGYLIVMFSILALSTISFDESDRSNSFLMTLPISRDLYVKEKYLFALLCSSIGCLISVIGAIGLISYKGNGNLQEQLISIGIIFLSIICIVSIMIPFRLKFHGEYGRMAFILAAGISVVAVNLFIYVQKQLGVNTTAVKEKSMTYISNLGVEKCFLLGIILTVLVVYIMYLISKNIIRKKEF